MRRAGLGLPVCGIALWLAACTSSGTVSSGGGGGTTIQIDAGGSASDAGSSTDTSGEADLASGSDVGPADAGADAANPSDATDANAQPDAGAIDANATSDAAQAADVGTDAAGTTDVTADVAEAGLGLKINISGAKSTNGQLCANVVNSGSGFPNNTTASVANTCVPFAQLPLVVQGLTVGATYGVSVFLDLNGNQKLDTNPLGIPTEGFGFSNNPTIGFGPPSWNDVKFVLGPDTASQTIKLIYFL